MCFLGDGQEVARGEPLSRECESGQARRLGIDEDHANSQHEKSLVVDELWLMAVAMVHDVCREMASGAGHEKALAAN
jgi:hypothetical protein